MNIAPDPKSIPQGTLLSPEANQAPAQASATGVLTVVSDRDAWQPADLSADGRFVAYVDRGDLNVWRWDRATGVSTLIGGQTFVSPSITSDGGSVAFEAHRTIDGLPRQDVLLWHAATGTIEQLTSGAGRSNEPSTSADGSTIAFYSTTTHLVPNDTNGFADVFVWHRPNVSQ